MIKLIKDILIAANLVIFYGMLAVIAWAILFGLPSPSGNNHSTLTVVQGK